MLNIYGFSQFVDFFCGCGFFSSEFEITFDTRLKWIYVERSECNTLSSYVKESASNSWAEALSWRKQNKYFFETVTIENKQGLENDIAFGFKLSFVCGACLYVSAYHLRMGGQSRKIINYIHCLYTIEIHGLYAQANDGAEKLVLCFSDACSHVQFYLWASATVITISSFQLLTFY